MSVRLHEHSLLVKTDSIMNPAKTQNISAAKAQLPLQEGWDLDINVAFNDIS